MGEKGNAGEALSGGAVGGGLPGIEVSAPGVDVTIGGAKREEAAAPEKCSNCGEALEGRDVCARCGLNWRTGTHASTDNNEPI